MKLKVKIILPIIIFLGFAYYLVGANFGAKLGIIDDHEIPLFLGSDGKISLNEIPKILATTEVGKYGQYLRFRPVYYSLRILEAKFFRTNAAMWYLARYIMLVGFMYGLWRILKLFFPTIVAYSSIFLIFTLPFWSDLLTRLGPSEMYALPATAAFTWGVITILREKYISKLTWWMYAAGLIVAVGSKENFLVLVPIVILVMATRIVRKWSTKREILLHITLIMFGAWVAGAIILATSNSGADVYGTSISYPARIREFVRILRYIIQSRHIELATITGTIASITIAISVFKKGLKRTLYNPLLIPTVTLLGLFLFVMSQYILYNNTLPTNSRYDFPAMILFPIMNLTAVKIIVEACKKLPKIVSLLTRYSVYLIACAVMLVLVTQRGYQNVRAQSQVNASKSQVFNQGMQKLQNAAEQNPNADILFVSERYWDYEPIISVERYINAAGVTNRLLLAYTPQELEPNDALGHELQDKLILASENGYKGDQLFERFEPRESLGNDYICLTFDKAESPEDCQMIVKF